MIYQESFFLGTKNQDYLLRFLQFALHLFNTLLQTCSTAKEKHLFKSKETRYILEHSA